MPVAPHSESVVALTTKVAVVEHGSAEKCDPQRNGFGARKIAATARRVGRHWPGEMMPSSVVGEVSQSRRPVSSDVCLRYTRAWRQIAVLMRCTSVGAPLAVFAACLPKSDLSSYDRGDGAARPDGRAALESTESVRFGADLPAPELTLEAHSEPEQEGEASSTLLPMQQRTPGSAEESEAPERPCADSSSPAPDGCVKHPGALRDENIQSVEVAGNLRSFIYYAPPTLNPEVPAPILILAHGRTVGALEFLTITQLESLADREGFLLLVPDGQRPTPWNIGQDNCPTATGPIPSATGDDQAFLDAMLGLVSADRALDAGHVFMAGFGAGGYWANDIVCRRPAIRAFAAHSAGSHALSNCESARAPAIIFHGLQDDGVPPNCGRETRARWAQRNGCSEGVESRPVLGGVCEYSTGCPEGGQVALCLFAELGLAWAGGIGQRDAPPADFASASELSWEFFKTYAW